MLEVIDNYIGSLNYFSAENKNNIFANYGPDATVKDIRDTLIAALNKLNIFSDIINAA